LAAISTRATCAGLEIMARSNSAKHTTRLKQHAPARRHGIHALLVQDDLPSENSIQMQAAQAGF
jgi:hypothetical protein